MSAADDLRGLGLEYWRWRAIQQPRPRDDIPRIERPTGWQPDWSAAAIARYRDDIADFAARRRAIDVAGEPVTTQVDSRLIGSAIARVEWELDWVRAWECNADFYIDQSLGTVYDVLLSSRPWDEARQLDLVRLMRHVPTVLAQAMENLGPETSGAFARVVIGELERIDQTMQAVLDALLPHLSEAASGLVQATNDAVTALERFAAWLEQRLPDLADGVAVGAEGFRFFLANVALLPYTPEQMVAMARQEADRASLFERLERIRNSPLPELLLPATAAEQIAREWQQDDEVRDFYHERELLSLPDSVRHYRTRPLPGYVKPLKFLGVTNDLTGPSRLAEDAINYVPEPDPEMGFFYRANAVDPRAGIMHEGCHYQQLALAWAHENPLRRHYYDSGPNEGIAFYNEELMLQTGLFDDSPRSRELVYRFLRLRALRVEFDIGLTTGTLDMDAAIDYLVENVPLDRETAAWETAFSASIPGFPLTYQIGKLQLLRFLTDALRVLGEAFDLRAFHDYVWKNGNVPFALLRWEYLGLKDELDVIDAAADPAAPV